jgi:hypothetical protein
VTATLPASAGTMLPVTVSQADTGAVGNAYPPGRTGSSVGDGGATLGGGAGRGASPAEQGHVRARFGGIPVLVTAEMAAQIKAFRTSGRDDQRGCGTLRSVRGDDRWCTPSPIDYDACD